MSKENKLIPALRFPEFVGEGEWQRDVVDNLASTITPPKKLTSSNYLKDGSFPIIDQSKSFYCGWTNDVDAVITESLPLIIFGDHTCILKIATVPFAQGADGIKILRTKDKIIPEFLYQFLKYNEVKLEDYKRHFSILKGKIVFFPNKENGEQQKIASCLSSLDKLITAHNQKLDLLRAHKKGLMQNLFPQMSESGFTRWKDGKDDDKKDKILKSKNLQNPDSDKVPKYRFKEFKNDWEWVEKKLDELAKRGSGHTPNKARPEYYNGGINWVSLADSNKLDNGYIHTTKIQISKDGIKNSSAVLHPAGTVILSRDAGVGKSAVLYAEMAVSQHFIAWICDETKLVNWFLYYILQILKPIFESIAVGSTIKTIGLPYFKELSITVPSIKEQQKIASCLIAVDALITAQAEKIVQLQLHKKGLMQGLFPNITNQP